MEYKYFSLKDAYCSYGVSVLLRNNGFIEDCHASYSARGSHEFHLNSLCNNGSVHSIACPTHQMAIEWMWRKYNIHIYAIPSGNHWEAEIYGCTENNSEKVLSHMDHAYADTYDTVIDTALMNTLENIKKIEDRLCSKS